jgi:hypothetical protein
MSIYHQIEKHKLHLSQKISIRTAEFGKIGISVFTDELSRTHGAFKYATQIHGEYELDQRLRAGFIQHYYTEEEAKKGHQETIRKLRNGEFQFIPEVYRMVIT